MEELVFQSWETEGMIAPGYPETEKVSESVGDTPDVDEAKVTEPS